MALRNWQIAFKLLGAGWLPQRLRGSRSGAGPQVAPVATSGVSTATTLQFKAPYRCNGERLEVTRCSGPADSDHCGVLCLDQLRRTPVGPLAAERGAPRGELAGELHHCVAGPP